MKKIEVQKTKPLYPSNGTPPFYDPNDLHTHIWKIGKLGIEDNPKIPTYADGKIDIKDCVYCKICHTIKDTFQSTVGTDIDTVTDIIKVIDNKNDNNNNIEETIFSDTINMPVEFVVNIVTPVDTTKQTKLNYEHLFHKPEGIFDNYLTIEPS